MFCKLFFSRAFCTLWVVPVVVCMALVNAGDSRKVSTIEATILTELAIVLGVIVLGWWSEFEDVESARF